MTKWAKLKLGIKLESHVAKLSGKVKRSGEADEAGEINSQKKVRDVFSTKKCVRDDFVFEKNVRAYSRRRNKSRDVIFDEEKRRDVFSSKKYVPKRNFL